METSDSPSIWSIFGDIDSQKAFDLLAAGVPTLIALFLIIYAHRVLSERLKEARDGNSREDAKFYRRNLQGVWALALLLLGVHAVVFVYTQMRAGSGDRHYVEGQFRNLPAATQITLTDGPDDLFLGAAKDQGNLRFHPWVLRAGSGGTRSFLIVVKDAFGYECDVDLPKGPGSQEMLLRPVFDSTREKIEKLQLSLPGSSADFVCAQIFGPNPVPQTVAPAGNVPGDFGALDAPRPMRHAGLLGWIAGMAKAADALDPDLERLLANLRSDDYRVRDTAQDALRQGFDQYRTWAVSVAEGRYLATERERAGLTWALSRLDALPRPDMFEDPDLPESLVRWAITQTTDPNPQIRENAKRFTISYPTEAMAERLRRIIGPLALAPAGATRQLRPEDSLTDTRQMAADALAHFAYNRGVLITLGIRDGIAGTPPLDQALAAFAEAQGQVAGLPEPLQLQYARIDYGLGWANAVGAEKQLPGGFSQDAAVSAFGKFLETVKGAPDYRYPWQVEIAAKYVTSRDYGLFAE
jgi:hypothetical protein